MSQWYCTFVFVAQVYFFQLDHKKVQLFHLFWQVLLFKYLSIFIHEKNQVHFSYIYFNFSLVFSICNVFYLSFKKLLTWNDLALVEKHKLYLCTFSFILSILRKEDQNLIKSVIQFYLRQSRICITKLCNGTNQLTQLQHDNVATKVI